MSKKERRIDTKLIHAGEARPRFGGAVAMPIFQSSTFESGGESNYHDIRYIRLNNTPNHHSLHRKLAELENAEGALVTSSGMAAITTALLTVLSNGDHLLAHSSLYGGTHDFINEDLPSLGISSDYIHLENPQSWKDRLRSNTRAIYVETITNPLIQVADLEAVVEFARQHGLVTLIDNTFASPINFRPAEWGFDLSLHSCTKYLNGHTDIVAGAVIGNGDWVNRIRRKLNHLGGTLDPHACFLLQRGMKTLALRMRHQNRSAQSIAEFLEGHPSVQQVNYPGLASHPQHQRARRLLDGCSGMISFELAGGVEEAECFIDALTLPVSAPSLGGVESLITRPALTSHSGMSAEQRSQAGVSDSLIRISVGIEAVEDLIEDFEQALQKAFQAVGVV
ncbi:MAG: aminotransferase class I/II-fold pyridoxal phosphate-dependent enzyme, partial [Acidobacteriota bacterium]